MSAISISIRRIAALGFPMAGEQVLIFGIALFDTALTGRLGAEALSAQVVANQWVLFTSVIYNITVIGGAILIAQRIGKRDSGAANDMLVGTLALAFLSGLVIATLTIVFSDTLLAVLGIPAPVVALGLPYFRLMALTFPINFTLLSAGGCIRGAGDARTPLLVMVTANVIHVIVAPLLVFGGGPIQSVGLVGIGLATLLSRGVGLLIMLGLLQRGVAGLRLAHFRPQLAEMKQVWKVGRAVGGEQIALRLAQLLNVRLVAGLGTGALAAYGVVSNTQSLILMLGVGFMTATLTLVGQQIGAGDGADVKQTGWQALRLSWAVLGGLALAFFLWPDVTRLFTSDERVLDLARSGLQIVVLGIPFEVVNQIMTGVLRGTGDTTFPMWMTAFGQWVVRLPLIVLFTQVLNAGVNAIWMALVIEMAVRAVLNVHRVRSGLWLRATPTPIPERQQV